MTHPPVGYQASTKADYDHDDVDDGALSPMPRGPLDDAAWRTDRARKARAAQNTPAHHLRQVLRAGTDHTDARWAVRIVADHLPRTPAEIEAARQLARALDWAADLAEVQP